MGERGGHKVKEDNGLTCRPPCAAKYWELINSYNN